MTMFYSKDSSVRSCAPIDKKGNVESDNVIAFRLLRALVGKDNVKTDLDERLHYSRSTLSCGTLSMAIVRPGCLQEVVGVMRIANQFHFVIHPFSSGKNWGYSDANAMTDGTILLDLGRMNKILDMNVESGYVTVEPGVTQNQIYSYLHENNIPLWMDATGAGPDTSVIGNTMERGFGHSPYGDRYANSCGYEVVLPNGDVIQTGFGRFENSQVTEVYKWGVGPVVDGLFTQSNLGIVTKMTFWLMPKPKDFCVALFILKEENDICGFTSRMAPLRMDGTLKSVVHIGNDLRMISMSRSYPFKENPKGHYLTMAERQSLVREQGVGFWTGTAGFYGTKRQVSADIKRFKQALAGFNGVKSILILTEKRLRFLEKMARGIRFMSRTSHLEKLVHKARLAFDLLKGSSPKNCVQSGLWRVRNAKSSDSTDPLDHGAGFYWISPVIPMQGKHIRDLIDLVEPIFHQYGFDFQQTLSMTTERALTSVMTISYDKCDEAEGERARQCHDFVVEKLVDNGYILYRAGNHTMQKIADMSQPSYTNFLQKIKMALDPNHVLSPGKYIPLRKENEDA